MSNEKISILYLDDEQDNLISFKANFRREYDIHTTTSAHDAIEILKNNKIHVVLSDQKMPDISGVEFFELLKLEFPDPIRILVTGYSDIDAIIAAINQGDVYRYIKKPWKDHELRMEIETAYAMFAAREESKQKQLEIERANSELEKFVYSASHDFRAPLASVLGLIQISKAEDNIDELRSYLNMMESSVKELDYYIQNIINFYQNRTEEVVINKIDFDLLIDEIFEDLKQLDKTKKTKFKKNIIQSSNFFSDELRVKTIFANLISNAIIYGDPSKKECFVEVEVNTESNDAVISISDNGVGIPLEKRKNLFDIFIQDNKKRGFGVGLGLYVTKESVDRLGGSLEVASEVGIGTTFTVKIKNHND